MTITICPRCQSRVLHDAQDEDIMHECNSGNLTLDEEDVIIVGDWSDYTGTGIEQNVNGRGIGNRLWGTRAWLQGENPKDVTKRGNNAATHRTRQHIEFITLNDKNDK